MEIHVHLTKTHGPVTLAKHHTATYNMAVTHQQKSKLFHSAMGEFFENELTEL